MNRRLLVVAAAMVVAVATATTITGPVHAAERSTATVAIDAFRRLGPRRVQPATSVPVVG